MVNSRYSSQVSARRTKPLRLNRGIWLASFRPPSPRPWRIDIQPKLPHGAQKQAVRLLLDVNRWMAATVGRQPVAAHLNAGLLRAVPVFGCHLQYQFSVWREFVFAANPPPELFGLGSQVFRRFWLSHVKISVLCSWNNKITGRPP